MGAPRITVRPRRRVRHEDDPYQFVHRGLERIHRVLYDDGTCDLLFGKIRVIRINYIGSIPIPYNPYNLTSSEYQLILANGDTVCVTVRRDEETWLLDSFPPRSV